MRANFVILVVFLLVYSLSFGQGKLLSDPTIASDSVFVSYNSDSIPIQTLHYLDQNIAVVSIGGYPLPGVRMKPAKIKRDAVILEDVPIYNWSYGCSATSAAMLAGYYDRHGYPNVYSGPTNGGIAPLTNEIWGSGLCPLSATKLGLDERTTKGHVDDFYINFNSSEVDPYITDGRTPHEYDNCVGDYMKTNQSAYSNNDGYTTFWIYGDGYKYTGPGPNQVDGTWGLGKFFESRGYRELEHYNQLIDTVVAAGFSFDDYMSEIDNGYPVLITLVGHTVLGVGYEADSKTVYLHDTWDHNVHEMIWGGFYSNENCVMRYVSVFHLQKNVPTNLQYASFDSRLVITWDYPTTDFDYFNIYIGASTTVSDTTQNCSYILSSPQAEPMDFTIEAVNVDGTVSAKVYLSDVTFSTTTSTIWSASDCDSWSSEANWSAGIPTETTSVIIPKSTTNPVIKADEQVTLDQLWIQEDASLQLLSNATETASLIVTGKTLQEGEIVCDRFLEKGCYHYISLPEKSNISLYFSDLETSTGENYMGLDASETSTDNLWQWCESFYWAPWQGCWEDLLFGTCNNSDMSCLNPIDARGYVYCNNSSDITLQYNGEVHTESVAYAATYTSDAGRGYHIVGNPFTSSIAINSTANHSNFLDDNSDLLADSYEAIYLWDEESDQYESADYSIISKVPVEGVSNFIQPGQAFMVKVDQSGDLNFNRSIQSHGTAEFYKNQPADWSTLTLKATSEQTETKTVVAFHPSMHIGLDPGYDVVTLEGNSVANLYTGDLVTDGDRYAIQSLPTDTKVVRVGINVLSSGTYDISATCANFSNYSIALIDNVTEDQIFLNKGEHYSIDLTEGEFEHRFTLLFKKITESVDQKETHIEMQIESPEFSAYSVNNTLYVSSSINENLQLFSISGAVVLQKNIESGVSTFTLNRGVYIVRIGQWTEKITIL